MKSVVSLFCLAASVFAWADSGVAPAKPDLTLDQALELALQNHPRLVAFAWDLRAADARRLQAGLRPNPEVSLDIEDMRWEDGADTTTTARSIDSNGTLAVGKDHAEGTGRGLKGSLFTLVVGQLIEFGRKRALRTALADHEKALVDWDYQTAKADVMTEVKKAFVDVLAWQEATLCAREAEELAGRYRGEVKERVAAGDASPIAALSADIPFAEAEVANRQAMQALENARRTLALTCGIEPDALGEVRGDLTHSVAPPSYDTLAKRIEANPDVARWAAEMEQRQAVINVETSKRIPDVSFTAGLNILGTPDGHSRGFSTEGPALAASAYRSHTKSDSDWDTTLVAGVSMPIPIFDRNQGGIKEAEYLASKASEERKAVLVAVRTSLSEAHSALVVAHEAVVVLRDTALPKAEEVVKLTEEGYKAGKFDYATALEAEEALLSSRTQYSAALADYHRAVADVERLVGGPLAE